MDRKKKGQLCREKFIKVPVIDTCERENGWKASRGVGIHCGSSVWSSGPQPLGCGPALVRGTISTGSHWKNFLSNFGMMFYFSATSVFDSHLIHVKMFDLVTWLTYVLYLLKKSSQAANTYDITTRSEPPPPPGALAKWTLSLEGFLSWRSADDNSTLRVRAAQYVASGPLMRR